MPSRIRRRPGNPPRAERGRYGSRNPFISEFTGDLRPGAEVRLRISPPDARAMSFTPTVTAVDEGRHLEWLGNGDGGGSPVGGSPAAPARDMTTSAASTTDVTGLPSPCGDGDHHIDHSSFG
jgi:hypothetical protein